MSECECIRDVLEHLAADINGTEEISVLREDGTVICCFPEKSENAVIFTVDLLTGIGEDISCKDMGDMTGLILKGKDHFAACYRIPDMDTVLGLYGKSAVNFGLLNSASRSACSRIREILYVPEE
ncbi:MAG: hypothetical protein AB7S75_16410 [Desulfococcaceae bacterium]